jgi:hypothetical protein
VQGDDANDFLLPFRGERKRGAEIQLFETLPVIDLGLVIDEASLFIRDLARPTGVDGIVCLRFGGDNILHAKRAERKKKKSGDRFHKMVTEIVSY